MQPPRFVRACVTVCGVVAALGMAVNVPADGNGPNMFGFADPTGVGTSSVNGSIDFDNPFFQSLGTNGRSCGSCHHPLLTKGLIRVRIVIPLNAEFELIDGYAFMPRPQWPDSHNSLSRDRGAICPARPCHTYY